MYVDMNSWPSEQLQIKTLRHMCLISAARGGCTAECVRLGSVSLKGRGQRDQPRSGIISATNLVLNSVS